MTTTLSSLGRAFANIALLFRPDSDLTPEQLEARRERRYRQRIQAEREQGRRFIQREAAQLRRELGL